MNVWGLRSTNHRNDEWEIFRNGEVVGSIFWVVVLPHPEAVKARIRDGLNQVHGLSHEPTRGWTFGTEGSKGRWDISRNGELKGEIAWSQIPADPPEVWQGHILAGLNFVASHLRAVS